MIELPSVPQPASLESESRDILPRLRGAIARVLTDIPAAGNRPATIARALGLHQTLAWKLAQIVQSPDWRSIARHIPGDGGIEIFLRAAAERGVDGEALESVRAAVGAYRQMTARHAGDRGSLELMLAGMSAGSATSIEVAARKGGYRCGSLVWGVQCRVWIKTVLLNRSATPGRIDVAAVRGFVGLRRVRSGGRWGLSCRTYRNAAGVAERTTADPIDRAVGGEIPLLPEFCSSPLPALERAVRPDGEVAFRLAPGPVGDRAAFDVFVGDVMTGVGSRWAAPDDPWFETALRIRTPSELLVIDTFVRRGLWRDPSPTARVLSEMSDTAWYDPKGTEADELPIGVRVEHLGRGPDSAYCPEYARYPQLAAHAFERLGWPADEFELYRLRLEYPVLRTAVIARFRRPDPPRRVGAG